MANKSSVDKPFLFISIILVIFGFFIFSSASLGLLARESSNYSSIAFSQTVLGLFLGSIAFVIASRVDFKIWKKFAFPLIIVALVLCILVLIPSIGSEHAGARRWFNIAGVSFQPVELLKIAFIIYFAAWASMVKGKFKTFKYGFLPFLILSGIVGVILLLQPDTKNTILLMVTGMTMYIAGGGKWRFMFMLMVAGIACIFALALMRPYVMQRIEVFFNPTSDSQGAGYQIQQSLIAVGSGGITGRGFGQSVQKFNFLPEPVGDSIFSVAAEEFGFVGAVTLILLFVAFATRGLKIASRVPDTFGGLTAVGIVIMIVGQAFANMGAMIGVIPLTGVTLPFVSHGGTSLFFTLLATGIVLSISRAQKLK